MMQLYADAMRMKIAARGARQSHRCGLYRCRVVVGVGISVRRAGQHIRTSNATHIYTPLTHAARHIEQLELMLDELETEAAAAAPQAVAMPTAAPEGDPPLRQKSPGRQPLPEHLPRAEIVHQLG